MPSTPQKVYRRSPSLTSLSNYSTNPPPIALWPTIFPPSGSLTPLLTSANPKHKIPALTAVISLVTTSKRFIIAAANTPPSATAFTAPSTIALSTATALCNLLPSLLEERHPIALAKTARLAAELSTCGLATPEIAEKLCEVVLEDGIDRTSRAAAASALVTAVPKADADRICESFSRELGNPLAPVAEMLAVLRAAVTHRPARFVEVWSNAAGVLKRVLDDSPVGLHAVRLVQAFVAALLKNEEWSGADGEMGGDGEEEMLHEEVVNPLLTVVYEAILVPAGTCDDQPMQLSAISAIDAFQRLSRAAIFNKLPDVQLVLRRLAKDASIPVQSAALKALGNHPVNFKESFSFLVTTPERPTQPRAKAFSATTVLLEKMLLTEEVFNVVEGFVQDAVRHLTLDNRDMSKAEKAADESLRVACLGFLGVAVARLVQQHVGEMDAEKVLGAVMGSALKASVNVRVHACKSMARILKDRTENKQEEIVELLCSLLDPSAPLRVRMAAARALLGMKDFSVLQSRQKLSVVHGCVICTKAREGIGDGRSRALRQAFQKLLGELMIRVVENGVDWRDSRVKPDDLYDCIAMYYRLPGSLKDRFERGDEEAMMEFPEEARNVLQRILGQRCV